MSVLRASVDYRGGDWHQAPGDLWATRRRWGGGDGPL